MSREKKKEKEKKGKLDLSKLKTVKAYALRK